MVITKKLRKQHLETRVERYKELYKYSHLARHKKQMLRVQTQLKNLKKR